MARRAIIGTWFARRDTHRTRRPDLNETTSPGAPAPGDDHPGADPSSGSDRGRPPGLASQARAAFAAARRLVLAHVALGKVELGAIAAEAKRVAALAGGALAIVLFTMFLLPVGLTLFMGEWLFGSMGWGVLLGTEASLALAVVLVLLAFGARRDLLEKLLGVALLVGLVVAVLFGLAWSNAAWAWLGEALAVGVDPAIRPLLVAVVASAAIGGIVGLVAAIRASGPRGATPAVMGLLAGAFAGALIGAFSAISFRHRVGVAIGVAVALALWPALGLATLRGFDPGSLKRRFWPAATIETTQETIGWLQEIRERTRRGWKS